MTETNELLRYALRPDNAYRWKRNAEHCFEAGDCVYDIRLESQTWQEILWSHTLQVFVPAQIDFPELALLKITGEMASASSKAEGRIMAEATGMICAAIHDVPNQPLFDDRFEDDLIAHTFTQYLDTGDADWPLLFPMVKSVMRGMDALKEFIGSILPAAPPLKDFILTGASKRGWTTWLAAVADPRVKAIIPQVYDNLNIFAQMPHQIEVWHAYSEMISDYTQADLQTRINTPQGRKLTLSVDPYTYLDKLTLPKLILNGTNDRYWATDALNLYWDDLQGPKHVLYAPNCGHSLIDEARLFATVTEFVRRTAEGTGLPAITWKFEESKTSTRLTITADSRSLAARLWVACSANRDFRNEEWQSTPMVPQIGQPGVFVGDFNHSPKGKAAIFGEIVLPGRNRPYTLSTQIRVVSG